MIVFQVSSLNFDVRFTLNEGSDYPEENTRDNEELMWGKKCVVMRAMRKKTKHIHASATDLLHIRIGSLNWYKCGHCKNEARKIDCLCCREIEVDTMLINSDKIPKCNGSISTSSFYWQLPDYKSHLLTLST